MNIPTPDRNQGEAIERLLEDASFEEAAFLPSMMSMGELLNCSAVEIAEGIHALSAKGYEFLVPDFDSPITIQKPFPV